LNNFSYFDDSYQKLKELNELLEKNESKIDLNLTDAQKEADRNRLEYFELENKFKEIKEISEEQTKKLAISDNLLEEITVSFDNLSLRTRIVNIIYFYT
jgi:hypothetical protein